MSSRKRKDFEACIAKEKRLTNPKSYAYSYCKRDITSEFHFVDIEHAIANAENQGRIITCPDCRDSVLQKVKNL